MLFQAMSKPVESRWQSYFLPGFHFGCLATGGMAPWFASDMQEKYRILSEMGRINLGHKLANLATTNCHPVTLQGSMFINCILCCACFVPELSLNVIEEKRCAKREGKVQ